jgi:hypothetical protein
VRPLPRLGKAGRSVWLGFGFGRLWFRVGWHLVAHGALLQSASAMNGIASVQKNAGSAKVEDQTEAQLQGRRQGHPGITN